MKKILLLAMSVLFVGALGCNTAKNFPERSESEAYQCWYMRGLSHISIKKTDQGNDSGASILASKFIDPCMRYLAYKDCREIMKSEEGQKRFTSEKACNRYFLGESE